MKNPLK